MEVSSSRMLTHIDMFFDYVPFISTVTNIVNIFQKFLIIPFIDKDYLKESHYFFHIQNKGLFRCVLLIVPILGNLIVIGVDSVCNRRDLEDLNDNLEILAEEGLKNIELMETLEKLKEEKKSLKKAIATELEIYRDRVNLTDRLISTKEV